MSLWTHTHTRAGPVWPACVTRVRIPPATCRTPSCPPVPKRVHYSPHSNGSVSGRRRRGVTWCRPVYGDYDLTASTNHSLGPATRPNPLGPLGPRAPRRCRVTRVRHTRLPEALDAGGRAAAGGPAVSRVTPEAERARTAGERKAVGDGNAHSLTSATTVRRADCLALPGQRVALARALFLSTTRPHPTFPPAGRPAPCHVYRPSSLKGYFGAAVTHSRGGREALFAARTPGCLHTPSAQSRNTVGQRSRETTKEPRGRPATTCGPP